MTHSDHEPRRAAPRPLQPLAKVVRDSINGEVPESVHFKGRARFLAAFETLTRRESQGSSSVGRPGQRVWLASAVAAVLVVGVALLLFRAGAQTLTYRVTGAVADRGYLLLPDAAASADVLFSDGSHIRVEPTTSSRITSVNAHGAHLVLERGRLEVDVVHRVGTTWAIEAGPYLVAITGTAFSMSWDNDELTVTMTRGSVTVQGPLARGGVSVVGGQRLSARQHDHLLSIVDQTLVEPAQSAPHPTLGGDSPAASADLAASPGSAPRLPVPPTADSKPWSTRISSGEYASVLREAEDGGLETTLSKRSLADIAALADAARYSHRNDIARRVRVAERARFPRSSEARAAAFLLARLAEEDGDMNAAANGYDRYLRESPRGSFAQEALGRQLALLWGRGDRTAALPIAERYLREFPQGPYTPVARDVASGP